MLYPVSLFKPEGCNCRVQFILFVHKCSCIQQMQVHLHHDDEQETQLMNDNACAVNTAGSKLGFLTWEFKQVTADERNLEKMQNEHDIRGEETRLALNEQPGMYLEAVITWN